jgi:tetratricopeptide (TPR) repeat protein
MIRVVLIALAFGYGLSGVNVAWCDSPAQLQPLLPTPNPSQEGGKRGELKTDYYNPQNILKFADYLYDEGDYIRAAGEYQRYLFYFPQVADKTLYKMALCYRLGGEIRRAIMFFENILREYPESELVTSVHYQIGYSYFLIGQYERSISYLSENLSEVEDGWKSKYLIGLNYLQRKRWSDARLIFDSLASTSIDEKLKISVLTVKKKAENGERLPYKHSIIAGFLSAILPGTGKMYCKLYSDGFFSLALIGGTGWLAYDGFHRGGINSVKGWFLGTLSGIFYLGNIYGSAVAAQNYNRRIENELLAKISFEVP